MSKFRVIVVPYDPKDTEPTLEDEFTMETISREISSINDPMKLKVAALNLLMVESGAGVRHWSPAK